MGMLGTAGERKAARGVSGFLGCMAQARGAIAAERFAARRSCRWHTKVSSRGGVRGAIESRARRRRARSARPTIQIERWMIYDFRSLIFEEEAGSQSTIRDQQVTCRQRRLLCLDHARMQHALHFCIVPQTRGAERSRSDRRDCGRKCAIWFRAESKKSRYWGKS
jgi:tRNA A37 methylthiotransferase MiaB